MPEVLKMREVTGLWSARVPDGPDSDQYPDTILLEGHVTFEPEYRVPLVYPGEHIVIEPMHAVIHEGVLYGETVVGDDVVRGSLFLPVTVDEDANQTWSWVAKFQGMRLGEYGEEVTLPNVRFQVPAGDDALDLSEVIPVSQSGNTITLRGPGLSEEDAQALVDAGLDERGLLPGGSLPSVARAEVEQIVADTASVAGVPIFETLAEAQAWEAANPGRVALTLEPSTPDVTPPTPGTLSVTTSDVSAALTVVGASGDRAITGYAFSSTGGTSWSGWQSNPSFTVDSLSPATEYTFRHKVRDGAGNEATGVAVVRSTASLPPRSPEDVGGLLGSWDMSDAVVDAGVITSVPDSVGGKSLTAATVGPDLVTEGGRQFAKFTSADSHRLRWTGAWGREAPYSICAIMRRGTKSGVAVNTTDAVIEVTGDGLLAGYNAVRTASVLGQADDLVLVTASVEAGGVTVRVGSGSQSAVGTTGDLGSNFTLGARSGGAGTAFTSPTVGRAWVHDRALTQADHDALTMWARGEWGVL